MQTDKKSNVLESLGLSSKDPRKLDSSMAAPAQLQAWIRYSEMRSHPRPIQAESTKEEVTSKALEAFQKKTRRLISKKITFEDLTPIEQDARFAVQFVTACRRPGDIWAYL